MTVEQYIQANIGKTLRQNVRDEGSLIGLPYPYIVPCVEGHFNELYYWDTYFTDKALFVLSRADNALNNTKNILYLIDRFGYMPNGNRIFYLKHSQPPYAALMVDDVYRINGDLSFLKRAFVTLKKEYDFWMTNRVSGNGLNHYDCEDEKEHCADMYNNCVAERIGKCDGRDPSEAGRHYIAECESGWDFNPRFGGFCAHYNAVDLNSNLYLYEKLFGEYEVLLGESDGTAWASKAKARAEKVNALLWDSASGVYRDYNDKTGRQSPVISAASFQPYFAGVAGEAQRGGLKKLLSVLEGKFGIFTTECVTEKYQWAYPNLWAPCQYIAVKSLEHYGYSDEAKCVAEKYVKLIERNFAEHGKLFEKYNGLTGGIDAVSEYGTPEMLGWTAGVYMECKKL